MEYRQNMQKDVPLAAAPSEPFEAADLIVAYLESIGVEYVFGIPGGAVEPFFNALARSARRGGPRPVLARHETGAAFMADGYARETGKIGVCISTSGPGATNMITGVACAYDNSVPLLVLTGQPALPTFGRRSFQESGCTGIDIVGMFRHCTVYNSLVSHPAQVENKLVGALVRANQSRRPAHLSLPVDVLRAPLPRSAAAYNLSSLMTIPLLADEGAIWYLCSEIAAAAQLVFIIGGGCTGAVDSIMQLVEQTGALFVSSPDGKGLIDPRHPAYRGVFGFAGNTSAAKALTDNPDLIVTIGTGMSEWNSAAWSEAMLNDRLIHVDGSSENLARTPMARLHVQGHIPTVFSRLARLLSATGRRPTPMSDAAPMTVVPSDASPLQPQRVMHELSQRCPPGTRFLADTGNSTAWAVHYLRPPVTDDTNIGNDKEGLNGELGWLSVTMDFAPMGWAIGAAIGAARGRPGRPIVCITGDGSFLMNGQEITVAQQEGLGVIFIVLNDGSLGMVKHGQRLSGAEPIAFQLPAVDFCAMAAAMGIPGHVIASAADFDAIDFDAIFTRRGPTLLDMRIDPDAVPPIGVRIKSLANVS